MSLGASALVEGLFNSSWSLGASLANGSSALFAQSIGAVGNTPTVTPAQLNFTPSLVEPNVHIPANAEAASLATFYELSQTVVAQLAELFSGYITEYFPDDTGYLQSAQLWLDKALTEGGTGIAPSIEAQIWDRDRARVLKEAQRLEDETVQTWAARRYPLPPGAATYQVLQVRKDASDKIAAASRDVAIKQAELEIANVRFAVENAIKLYGTAMGAATEYIKALAIGPNSAMQVIPSITDSQSKLIGAASDYYRARISAEELRMKAKLPGAEWDQQSRVATAGFTMEGIKTRVQAAVSAAQSMGTQAAASLNSLHASASLGSSTSAGTSVGYSYSNDTLDAPPAVTNVTVLY
jgi:hypothetical protein